MNSVSNIPFLDLVTVHSDLEEELASSFRAALNRAAFIGGPEVEQFEKEFAAFCNARWCVGVGSGTDAVRFSLMAAGVGPGDRVVTVPNTFIATTEAVSQAGARPEFVDIDEHTYTMDPQKLAEYLETKCTLDAKTGHAIHRESGAIVRAVIPVHLYGQTADMDPILDLAHKYNMLVIEDACQAHGAEYNSRKEGGWKKAGSMGKAAAFSFYPGKNLGACGEAGAVTTNDESVARYVRMLRDHGQPKKYYHDVEGYNGRLDAIQAGILRIKLRHLAEWNEQRRQAAARYRDLLADHPGLVLPVEPAWAKSVYHLFVVRTAERDALLKHLADSRIGTGIHYPIPLHLQKAYERLGHKPGDFPVAERASAEVLSLPMYPQLQAEQQRYVAEQIDQFLQESATPPAAAVLSHA